MGLQVRVGLLGLRNGLGRVAGLFSFPRDHPCHDGVFFMCFFERAVQMATQVLSYYPIQLIFACRAADVVCGNKALEHQVDDVGGAESGVDNLQAVNAVKQLGIEPIRHLFFPRAPSRHSYWHTPYNTVY